MNIYLYMNDNDRSKELHISNHVLITVLFIYELIFITPGNSHPYVTQRGIRK